MSPTPIDAVDRMIRLDQVQKYYTRGENRLHVLRDINLQIQKGEFIAITGPSGSGKSTLMSVLGCLDTIDGGEYYFYNKPLTKALDDELARLRNRYIGFVFQNYNLVPRLTALRNVELPLVYAGMGSAQRRTRAQDLLNALGLHERAGHTPAQLSGGQQQRVAIARALANNPEIVIADEPTGSLDSHAAKDVMQLFTQLHRRGKTIVLVTHDTSLVSYARRHIQLLDGRIVADESI